MANNIYKYVMYIIVMLVFLSVASPSLAIYPPQHTPAYSDNKILIKYKDASYVPTYLQTQATERKNLKASGITGQLSYYYQTMTLKAQGQKTPEELLQTNAQTEKQLGVISNKDLFTPLPHLDQGVTAQEELSRFRVIETDRSEPIEKVLEAYKSRPEVEWAIFNTIFTIQETPNDPKYTSMWALAKIQADKAWDITKGSEDVTVAVLDTGADFNHPDLKDHLIPGYDTTNTSANGQDDHYHGTHVSGTIGAVSNNSVGVTGINWNIKIVPVKVLKGSGQGSLQESAQGIRWVADNAQAKNIKVINMSLGGPKSGNDPCTTLLNGVIKEAMDKGVTVVAAAGNDGANTSNYAPASCDGVLTVGATGQNDSAASFSNWGPRVNLSAPGVNIESTVPNGYRVLQGTSMASPHVAGVVALMYAVNNTITPDQVKSLLTNPANLDPLVGVNTSRPIGAGRLNALKAVQAAQSSSTEPTTSPQPTDTPQPGITTSPSLTPTRTTTMAPTRQPTPTMTPIVIPTPPPYVCTPKTIPAQQTSTECTCQTGSCSAECVFASPSVSPLSPTPSTSTCPEGFSCMDPRQCAASRGGATGISCGGENYCCYITTPSATPTIFDRSRFLTPEPTRPTVSNADFSTASLKCSNSAGQDDNAFCRRSLRTVGDADGNDVVDILDYMYLNRAMSNEPVPSHINADFNGDGKVDSADKTIIVTTLKSLCY